jgi:L-ribulose-5-phosphate 3-epimerase
MKTYEIGLYEKALPLTLAWRDRLNAAKDCGYDWLEISIDETDDKLSRLEWGSAQRKELVDLQYDVNVPIKTMCLSGHRKYPLGSPTPATRARGLDIMQKAINLACDLGVRIIQIAGYDVYYEEHSEKTEALFVEGLRQSAEWAARAGVTLAFETMETPFINTVGKALHFVNAVQSPWLQVYPDIGNITNAALAEQGSTAAAINDLRSGAGHISALHLKESKPGVYREVPYGEGHVDFPGMVQTALGMGVRMFTTEFWYKEGQAADWKEWVRFHKSFVDKVFAGIL